MLTIDSYWYAHVRSSGQILQERSGDPRGHFLPAVLLSHRKSLRDLWFPREGWCGPFLLQPWWVGFRTRGWWEESFASGESGGGAPISGKGTSAKITKWHVLTRSARMILGISAKVGWKWKWSEKCRESELSIICCISTTNIARGTTDPGYWVHNSNHPQWQITYWRWHEKQVWLQEIRGQKNKKYYFLSFVSN